MPLVPMSQDDAIKTYDVLLGMGHIIEEQMQLSAGCCQLRWSDTHTLSDSVVLQLALC